MNLLGPWIPVLRASGYARIAPQEIVDARDPVLQLAAPRPDFNSSLMQFLIGLLQTACPPEGNEDWVERYLNPPTPEQLGEKLAKLTPYFELDGDGVRFMQDFSPGDIAEQGAVGIAALLIDAPGEQAQKFNKDLFVKRGGAAAICPACAAAALLTLQTHAPAGGAGHRTSLRGGGPLSTWVLSGEVADCAPTFWRDLWLNVLDAGHFLSLAAPRSGLIDAFPWAVATRTSEKKGSELTQLAGPADWLYWASPRRIRLDFDETHPGVCALCGEVAERLVKQYRTRNYGANYTTGWRHPLSPYYKTKPADPDFLPQHPKGGVDYRDWLALTSGTSGLAEPAAVAVQWSRRRDALRRRLRLTERRPARLAANGYDMDNMKPLCWHESVMPLMAVTDERFIEDVRAWIAGAELAGSYLRGALKAAWFSSGATVNGDFGFALAAYWQATEPDFYRLLERLAGLFGADDGGGSARLALKAEWQQVLERAALALFEQHAESGPAEQGNAKRVALAHQQLLRNLSGPKLKAELGLSEPATAGSAKARKKPAKAG